MKTIGETHPGDQSATWVLDVHVPTQLGEHELLCGDCRIDMLVSETTTTLRCTMKMRVPVEDLLERRPHPGWATPLNMDLGIFTLTCPLPLEDRGREVAVAVRMQPARIELFVDGVLVDEEWPWTPLRGDGPVIPRSARVKRAEFYSRMLSDEELSARIGKPLPQRQTELLGAESTPPQYWRPRGHNTTAGDVMLCVHRDELHLFYLFDRRNHASKWMAGAHQFHHLSSTDLRAWKEQPPAIAIEEPWEAIGTGTCISDGERMILFYEQHGERYLNARSRRGMWYATSDDGVAFTKHQGHCPEIVQPGLFKTAEAQSWNIISGQKRYTSSDLQSWTCIERDFLPELPQMSNECPCYFQFGQWHYIAIGRTGFFMSQAATGPYWNKPEATQSTATPAWDIYDGLMVPSIVNFKGRLILAGWIGCYSGPGWGGVLVIRELEQRADGNLYLRWLPELLPAGGEWLPVAISPVTDTQESHGKITFEPVAGKCARAEGSLPCRRSESFHLKFEVAFHDQLTDFSLLLGPSDGPEPALELRFEPQACRIQWGRADDDTRAPESHGIAADGEDFAIRNVEGMERPFSVEVIVKRLPTGTVVDAAFNFGRTMITRRGDLPVERLTAIASGGAASVSNVLVRTIE